MPNDSERPEFPAALAEFITDLPTASLPASAIENVEHSFLDTIGVALAGVPEDPGRLAGSIAAASSGGTGPATLWGREEGASVLDAALANGTASHALDFDDVTPAKTGHPSAPMVAAIVATAELGGQYSGTDLIESYVAGFETQALLSEVINPSHYQQGWHSTATMGTFGSAMAVASLLDLSPVETRHALNVASSLSAGLIRNFGSMTKPLHAGHAAQAGATAALLARDGFTGAEDAITGDRGYFDLYFGGEVEYPVLPESADDLFIATDGVSFKKYPSCNRTHTSIAAATHLVEKHDIDPEDIESLTVAISQRGRDVLHYDDPDVPLEGKFSLPYTVANAVVHRHVGIDTFTEDRLADPTIQTIRENVEFVVNEDLPYSSYESRVEITTSEGTVDYTVVDPPGQYDNPMSRAELRSKFIDCANRVIDDDIVVDDLADELCNLRNADAEDVVGIIEEL